MGCGERNKSRTVETETSLETEHDSKVVLFGTVKICLLFENHLFVMLEDATKMRKFTASRSS